jgi:uncharacterized membrane-anchored protein YhcB (DUF1043 family)
MWIHQPATESSYDTWNGDALVIIGILVGLAIGFILVKLSGIA